MNNPCNGSFFSGVALRSYYKTGLENDSNNSACSLDYEVIRALGKYLSFSYRMDYIPRENQSLPKIGLHPALLETLHNKKADFAVGHISSSNERMKIVRLSFPYYVTALSFVVKSRLQDGLHVDLPSDIFFLGPFPTRLWMTYIALVVVVATILRIFAKIDQRILKEKCTSNLLKYCFRVILRQDVPRLITESIGIRLLISLWMLVSMLFGFFYCGELTSSTSLLQKQEIVMTIDDLVKAVANNEFDAFSIKGNSHDRNIMESTSGPLEVFRNNIERKNLRVPSSLSEAFDRIMTEKSAFLISRISAKLFIQNNKVNPISIYVTKEAFYEQFYSVAFEKSFPCVEEMNEGIIRFIEIGLTQKWERTMTRFYSYQVDKRLISSEADYIVMSDQKSSFLLLAIGLLVSLCTLLTEQCLTKSLQMFK